MLFRFSSADATRPLWSFLILGFLFSTLVACQKNEQSRGGQDSDTAPNGSEALNSFLKETEVTCYQARRGDVFAVICSAPENINRLVNTDHTSNLSEQRYLISGLSSCYHYDMEDSKLGWMEGSHRRVVDLDEVRIFEDEQVQTKQTLFNFGYRSTLQKFPKQTGMDFQKNEAFSSERGGGLIIKKEAGKLHAVCYAQNSIKADFLPIWTVPLQKVNSSATLDLLDRMLADARKPNRSIALEAENSLKSFKNSLENRIKNFKANLESVRREKEANELRRRADVEMLAEQRKEEARRQAADEQWANERLQREESLKKQIVALKEAHSEFTSIRKVFQDETGIEVINQIAEPDGDLKIQTSNYKKASDLLHLLRTSPEASSMRRVIKTLVLGGKSVDASDPSSDFNDNSWNLRKDSKIFFSKKDLESWNSDQLQTVLLKFTRLMFDLLEENRKFDAHRSRLNLTSMLSPLAVETSSNDGFDVLANLVFKGVTLDDLVKALTGVNASLESRREPFNFQQSIQALNDLADQPSLGDQNSLVLARLIFLRSMFSDMVRNRKCSISLQLMKIERTEQMQLDFDGLSVQLALLMALSQKRPLTCLKDSILFVTTRDYTEFEMIGGVPVYKINTYRSSDITAKYDSNPYTDAFESELVDLGLLKPQKSPAKRKASSGKEQRPKVNSTPKQDQKNK